MYYVNIYTSKTYRGEKLTKSNTVISSESSLARSRFRKFVIASAVNSREHNVRRGKTVQNGVNGDNLSISSTLVLTPGLLGLKQE